MEICRDFVPDFVPDFVQCRGPGTGAACDAASAQSAPRRESAEPGGRGAFQSHSAAAGNHAQLPIEALGGGWDNSKLPSNRNVLAQ